MQIPPDTPRGFLWGCCVAVAVLLLAGGGVAAGMALLGGVVTYDPVTRSTLTMHTVNVPLLLAGLGCIGAAVVPATLAHLLRQVLALRVAVERRTALRSMSLV